MPDRRSGSRPAGLVALFMPALQRFEESGTGQVRQAAATAFRALGG